MAYLIAHVVKAESETRKTIDSDIIARLSKRHKLGPLNPTVVRPLLKKNGFEMGPILEMARKSDWPLTAMVYTSHRKDGYGRAGSSLHSLPCRRMGGRKST